MRVWPHFFIFRIRVKSETELFTFWFALLLISVGEWNEAKWLTHSQIHLLLMQMICEYIFRSQKQMLLREFHIPTGFPEQASSCLTTKSLKWAEFVLITVVTMVVSGKAFFLRLGREGLPLKMKIFSALRCPHTLSIPKMRKGSLSLKWPHSLAAFGIKSLRAFHFP